MTPWRQVRSKLNDQMETPMGSEENWMGDWEAFVNAVGRLFGSGLDDDAVTGQFAGKQVVWKGKVRNKRLEITRPGIQMEMPAVTVNLTDGRHAKVDFLFLTLREGEAESWRGIDAGTDIHFATQIRGSSGPFAGISWSDLGDNRGLILFLTDGAVPQPRPPEASKTRSPATARFTGRSTTTSASRSAPGSAPTTRPPPATGPRPTRRA
jgi:hypothetical protein